eukprot:PhM_4_TR5737/c0_g1_i2/m.39016
MAPLKGVLKGCAEQNAIGAMAAQGVPYCNAVEMKILAIRVSGKNDIIMPCCACQNYLNKVGEAVQRSKEAGEVGTGLRVLMSNELDFDVSPTTLSELMFPT